MHKCVVILMNSERLDWQMIRSTTGQEPLLKVTSQNKATRISTLPGDDAGCIPVTRPMARHA